VDALSLCLIVCLREQRPSLAAGLARGSLSSIGCPCGSLALWLGVCERQSSPDRTTVCCRRHTEGTPFVRQDNISGKRGGEPFFGSPLTAVLEVTLIFFFAQFPRLSSRDMDVQPEGGANQAIKELAEQGPPPSRLLRLVANTKAFLESDR
jgi:hypothetical protein